MTEAPREGVEVKKERVLVWTGREGGTIGRREWMLAAKEEDSLILNLELFF